MNLIRKYADFKTQEFYVTNFAKVVDKKVKVISTIFDRVHTVTNIATGVSVTKTLIYPEKGLDIDGTFRLMSYSDVSDNYIAAINDVIAIRNEYKGLNPDLFGDAVTLSLEPVVIENKTVSVLYATMHKDTFQELVKSDGLGVGVIGSCELHKGSVEELQHIYSIGYDALNYSDDV